MYVDLIILKQKINCKNFTLNFNKTLRRMCYKRKGIGTAVDNLRSAEQILCC